VVTHQISPDTLLRRKQLAAALADIGYPVASASLATMASRGGGPPFHKFGRAALYRWSEAQAWAAGRLSTPRHSTSESCDASVDA
jgi:hypothetical protein